MSTKPARTVRKRTKRRERAEGKSIQGKWEDFTPDSLRNPPGAVYCML